MSSSIVRASRSASTTCVNCAGWRSSTGCTLCLEQRNRRRLHLWQRLLHGDVHSTCDRPAPGGDLYCTPCSRSPPEMLSWIGADNEKQRHRREWLCARSCRQTRLPDHRYGVHSPGNCPCCPVVGCIALQVQLGNAQVWMAACLHRRPAQHQPGCGSVVGRTVSAPARKQPAVACARRCGQRGHAARKDVHTCAHSTSDAETTLKFVRNFAKKGCGGMSPQMWTARSYGRK